MIIVTGGAGFIGSCMVSRLNQAGRQDILIVDRLGTGEKWRNLRKLAFWDFLDKDDLFDFLASEPSVDAIIHMGACSVTSERDADYMMSNNYRYTFNLAQHCLNRNIRFIYASSAATYGDGALGYADDEQNLAALSPLNVYGYSKQVFDLKARREGWLNHIAGLKFFNVYGPNEYHKGDMVSVVFRAFNQIKERGYVELFQSHRDGIAHGEQKRDFIYVMDVVNVMYWLLENPNVNGLFNLGTGNARTFRALAEAAFAALNLDPDIRYIPMPEHLRGKYQYYTQAEMAKLREAGYSDAMHDLEAGVADYVRTYLDQDQSHF